MKEFKECQECKKVFKLPKCSQKLNEHMCPYCSSWNTVYITKNQYDNSYRKSILNNGLIMKCPSEK